MIDSLKIFETLKEHLPENHARTVTKAIQLADVDIEQDMRSFLREALRDVATKSDLRATIADFRGEVAEKLSAMEVRIIRWMFLFWIGQVGVMIALIKVLR
jgi:hypothetical protein